MRDHHSLILAVDGRVYSVGHSGFGQLGLGEVAGHYVLKPTEIEALRGVGVCSVVAGGAHSLAATADGRVFGWGDGYDESLGLGLTAHQRVPMEYAGLTAKMPPGP